jgi:hypothetical protein
MTDDLPELVLEAALPRWQKAAMVIVKVCEAIYSEAWSEKLSDDEAERIRAVIVKLVDSGRLESRGDLSKSRHSEIRLPA